MPSKSIRKFPIDAIPSFFPFSDFSGSCYANGLSPIFPFEVYCIVHQSEKGDLRF